jgi:hypothetical protein
VIPECAIGAPVHHSPLLSLQIHQSEAIHRWKSKREKMKLGEPPKREENEGEKTHVALSLVLFHLSRRVNTMNHRNKIGLNAQRPNHPICHPNRPLNPALFHPSSFRLWTWQVTKVAVT